MGHELNVAIGHRLAIVTAARGIHNENQTTAAASVATTSVATASVSTEMVSTAIVQFLFAHPLIAVP
jgi:hypothetical protein